MLRETQNQTGTCHWYSPPSLAGPAPAGCKFCCCFLLLFLFFNDCFHTSYLNICLADRRWICRVDRTAAVDDQAEISFFRSLEGRCHGNQLLSDLSTELSSGDIRQMALAYGKNCNWFAGRRRLVAQPGGLIVGFCRAFSLHHSTFMNIRVLRHHHSTTKYIIYTLRLKKRHWCRTLYSLHVHQTILKIFGRNVAETVSHQIVVCFPISPN